MQSVVARVLEEKGQGTRYVICLTPSPRRHCSNETLQECAGLVHSFLCSPPELKSCPSTLMMWSPHSEVRRDDRGEVQSPSPVRSEDDELHCDDSAGSSDDSDDSGEIRSPSEDWSPSEEFEASICKRMHPAYTVSVRYACAHIYTCMYTRQVRSRESCHMG